MHISISALQDMEPAKDVTSASVSGSAATNTKSENIGNHSRLLELPAELRNSIYRLVLLPSSSSEDITVDTTYRLPPLLHTNRQLRNEAASIYFLENKFSILYSNYSCRIGLAFDSMVDAIIPGLTWAGNQAVTLEFNSQNVVWENLLEWVYEWYHDRTPRYTSKPRPIPQKQAVSKAFLLVDHLKQSGFAWEHAKPVLEVYKDTVAQQARGVWTWS